MNEQYVFQIPEISQSAKYWLVRTTAGENYSRFISNNYIAIGWNEIKEVPVEITDDLKNSYKELFKSNDEYSKLAGLYLNTIKSFQHEMSIGDFVVIPSHNTNKRYKQVFSIGIIESDMYYSDLENDDYKKQRRVRWIKKNISKSGENEHVAKIFYRYHAISNIDSYGDFIDYISFPFHIKDNKIIIHTRVNYQYSIESIKLAKLLTLHSSLLEGHNCSVFSKISVYSPGDIISIITPENIDAIGKILKIILIYRAIPKSAIKDIADAIADKIKNSKIVKVKYQDI